MKKPLITFKYLILLPIGLFMMPNLILGQVQSNEALKKKILDISECIMDNYRPDDSLVQILCLRTVVFLKFEIDKKGCLNQVDFNRDIPEVIKEGFVHAIDKFNEERPVDLNRKDLKKIKYKIFIYPIEFNYTWGCESHKSWGLSKDVDKGKTIKNLLDEIQGYKTNEGVFKMLSFENNTYDMLECVLLSPSSVSTSR